MRFPSRGWIAVALGWAGALVLYLVAGHLSLVLLLGPVAFMLGDAAAERRRVRLQALVDAAFPQLLSDDEPGFNGRTAVVLRQRSRLLGLRARLVDVRIVRGADGTHWAVRAEATGPSVDGIAWRVTRLSEQEARAATAR